VSIIRTLEDAMYATGNDVTSDYDALVTPETYQQVLDAVSPFRSVDEDGNPTEEQVTYLRRLCLETGTLTFTIVPGQTDPYILKAQP